MGIKLVIFDCDGVLFESAAANIGFCNEVLRRAGEPPMDRRAEKSCEAMSSRQFFDAHYGGLPELRARLGEEALKTDYDPFFKLMKPVEGLRSELAALRALYKTAMATNRGKTTTRVLEVFGLNDLFDFAVGALDVDSPKPSPSMLLSCLAHFGLGPDEAVYVGDQASDAEASLAAGIVFVGMGSVAASCDLVARRLSDLHAIVAGLGRGAGT
ncbi:MAG: HAD family hydrolase [Candidatus Binatia bacterium]